MGAGHLDACPGRSSFRGLDPRTKIVSVISFIVIVTLLKDPWVLTAALAYVLAMLGLSAVGPTLIVRRYLLAAPFALLGALSVYSYAGIQPSIAMFLRISTCVLALVLLTTMTPFFDLLKGLQSLRVPRIFVSLLLFTYRYLFVISDEMQRMALARKARGARKGRHLLDREGMRTISYTAGMVFVRAYERGKRMHEALRSRGYDGEIRTLTPLRINAADILFFCLILVFGAILLSTDRRLVPWA
jgi:cobalt/nickel transport system permease protein